MRAAVLVSWLIVVGACGSTAPTPTTGLAGVVVRGPVTPVCQEGVPCDAPLAAEFVVERANRRVAGFRSGSDGRFEVRLAPGRYTVVPGRDAPLLSPGQQRREVEVGPTGLTEVTLLFDTGIR